MTNLKNIQAVYFLGIGGIGMSALARYFNSIGVRVSGYDRTETVLTRELTAEGISVHYTDDIQLADTKANLIVYTPAIPADHQERRYFEQNGYTILKRSDVLGIITSGTFSICVAGTHGKTTTSSLIAHILRHSGYGCNAFLGGIAVNYNSNFWSSERAVSVAEADEYDRSFLKLSPDIAVISSMDPDHLDIYGTAENLQDAFVAFTGKVKPGGYLIYKYGLPRTDEFRVSNAVSYHVNDPAADVHAENIRVTEGNYCFDVQLKETRMESVVLPMGGRHNIENAVAAVAVANKLGIADEKIKAALLDFRGVRRRFEYALKTNQRVLIDDYAHHPEELRALIQGAREMYPGRRCVIVFQPHLFSRTHDLADGFAEVLSAADEICLLPIYPARELPMPGVSSALIAERMTNKNVQLLEKSELVTEMNKRKPDLLLMAGAGDIDTLVEPVKQALTH
jgi:UDP-N-acetylmuramate--alanine ligase